MGGLNDRWTQVARECAGSPYRRSFEPPSAWMGSDVTKVVAERPRNYSRTQAHDPDMTKRRSSLPPRIGRAMRDAREATAVV